MTVTLLDGGMGQELVRRSKRPPTPLWATRIMLDNPDLVGAVHDDFFAAGAEIATTNTYSIHRDRLIMENLENRFTELHRIALDQVKAARARHGAGLIAGSIGPLGASYRPDIHPDAATALPLYREVAELLAPEVDILICETVASLAHARIVLEGCRGLGKPVWMAVTVDDEDGTVLRSGEPVADVVQIVRDGADAVLANCSAPEAMPAAMERLSAADLPIGAYANAFTQITKEFLQPASTVDALTHRRDMGPETYADHVDRWIAQGASIVGGCCEVGPAHIAEIARRLQANGSRP